MTIRLRLHATLLLRHGETDVQRRGAPILRHIWSSALDPQVAGTFALMGGALIGFAGMGVSYRVNAPVSVDQYIDILNRSTLGARRPVDDRACIEQMVEHANLMISAWVGDTLVGVSRSITDFGHSCYLADLAVDERYQRRGIGEALIAETRRVLGPRCKIRLISAPDATGFYRKVGFTPNPNCWELR